MQRPTRSILFLALAVALLGAAVYAELGRERSLAAQPLTHIDTDLVRRLQIQCLSCTTRVFERSAGVWQMTAPYHAAADPQAVARLLALAHAPVRTHMPIAGYDRAKLGLDPPRISVTIDELRIDIGGEDPIDHDRYVRIGNELLRVPDRFSARLLEAPESEVADPSATLKN